MVAQAYSYIPAGPDHMIGLFIVCICIGFAGYAAISGDRAGCTVVAALGVLWLWVNKPVEGPILVTLTHTHGITLADTFSLACFGMAALGWNRRPRDRGRQPGRLPHPRGSRRH